MYINLIVPNFLDSHFIGILFDKCEHIKLRRNFCWQCSAFSVVEQLIGPITGYDHALHYHLMGKTDDLMFI